MATITSKLEGNYFFLTDVDSGREYEALAKDVRVRRELDDSETYFFDNVNGWQSKMSVTIGEGFIDDSTQEAWTQEAWRDWYTISLGKSSGGDTPKKEFVIYIGSQDETGFLNSDIRENGFDDPFVFTRVSTATFSCPTFDPTKHFIETSFSGDVGFVTWSVVDSALYTLDFTSATSDFLFASGGFIKITEYPII